MSAGRQIGFDNTGRVLVVTEVATSLIDTFVLGPADTPGPGHIGAVRVDVPVRVRVRPEQPDRRLRADVDDGHRIDVDLQLTGAGAVSPIDTQGTNGILPCWVAVTSDGRYVFVVNTGAGMPAPISRYSLAPNGKLTLLGLTPSTRVSSRGPTRC